MLYILLGHFFHGELSQNRVTKESAKHPGPHRPALFAALPGGGRRLDALALPRGAGRTARDRGAQRWTSPVARAKPAAYPNFEESRPCPIPSPIFPPC